MLNVLCYCLIDFKLCLLGNTPPRACYGRSEMFFPNAALWLVNSLRAWNGLRACIENRSRSNVCSTHCQFCLAIPMARDGTTVWHTLSVAVDHCRGLWPSLNCSAAVLPLRDWLEQARGRDICVMCVYVIGLLMSSQVFPHFRELVLSCFSSGRCSSPLGPLLGGKKH